MALNVKSLAGGKGQSNHTKILDLTPNLLGIYGEYCCLDRAQNEGIPIFCVHVIALTASRSR
jgi:hypothetical protein